MKSFSALLAIALSLLACELSFGAEVRLAKTSHGKPLAGIMIEGIIERGDYNKFVNAFIDNPGRNGTVYLYSTGGDFLEALKIGRLVHALKLTTWAPEDVEKRLPLNEVLDPSNRVCASSCFFIFVAGAQRFGGIVGIHRPYLPSADLKKLSMSEAGQAHLVVAEIVRKYLKDMDVPMSYADRLMSIDSEQIEWLSGDEILQHFHGFAPAYREWIAAVCPPVTDEEKARMLHILKSTPVIYKNMPVAEVPYPKPEKQFLDRYFAKDDAYYACRNSVQQREIDRLWAQMYARRHSNR